MGRFLEEAEHLTSGGGNEQRTDETAVKETMSAKAALQAQRAVGVVEQAGGEQKRKRRQLEQAKTADKHAPRAQQLLGAAAVTPQQQRVQTVARAAAANAAACGYHHTNTRTSTRGMPGPTCYP